MTVEELKNLRRTCCVCGKEYTGFGNNAEPVMEGRCCDECNRTKVLPLRMMIYNLRPDDYHGRA